MTMPIGVNGSFKKTTGSDLEFGVQASESQKRKSMKRMSKVVEVNDSAEQDQSERNAKAKMGGDHMYNAADSNQLQSLQSLA